MGLEGVSVALKYKRFLVPRLGDSLHSSPVIGEDSFLLDTSGACWFTIFGLKKYMRSSIVMVMGFWYPNLLDASVVF